MRPRARFRPSLETLEDRSVPAIMASVTNSVLNVSGSATVPLGQIEVRGTAVNASNNNFQVYDSGALVGTFTAKNVRVVLTSDNDDVLLNLNGLTMRGNACVNLGNGDNTFVVQNGTINDGLSVYGGRGKDDLLVFNTTIANNRNTYLYADGGIDDTLLISGASNLTGNVYANQINTITFGPGNFVGGSFFIYAGTGPNDVTLDGDVGNPGVGTGDVLFYSDYWTSYDSNELTVGGKVGRDVRFTSSVYSNFGNKVTLEATADIRRDVSIAGSANNDMITVLAGAKIARDFSVFAGAGDDMVNVGNATIGRTTYLYLGAGNDTLNYTATTGLNNGSLAFYLDAGDGDDVVTMDVTAAKIRGTGTVKLGAGADRFTRNGAGNTTYLFTIDGGAGVDTYTGSVDNLVLLNIP